VAWLAGVPGETVRTLIREGTPPEPERILDGLAPLWSAPAKEGRPLDLSAAFRWTDRVLSGALSDCGEHQMLSEVTDVLGPFAEAWRPSALAHNDFYDGQIILTPDGRLALVDFEEVGPGDPMMDVGMLLAHLRWMARFDVSRQACDGYRRRFRAAALDRFGWDGRELALREAFALFRLSSNPVRNLQHNWSQAVETGLGLVLETLDDAA
jgi:aminoglycoside phosphotransferase (APT) family kinase protein